MYVPKCFQENVNKEFLKLIKKKNNIMNKFECSECGTIYRSPETTPPPGIKWSDGHVCTPKLVDNEHISKN